VFAGATLTAMPLVMGMFPGVMTPAPPLKVAMRLVLPPLAMLSGDVVKEEMAGAVTIDIETVAKLAGVAEMAARTTAVAGEAGAMKRPD
jgi:hypothetical protein